MIKLPQERLMQQLQFLQEIDKLKTVYRRAILIADPTRFENSAEHSWHLALFAVTLSEYANEPVDLLKVFKLVLFHDLVEVYTGDTYAYDTAGQTTAHERELEAAKTLFGLLPADQRDEFMQIWLEFEAGETAEAKFAVSIDRLQPLILNYITEGASWKKHKVAKSQVMKRMQPMKKGSDTLNDVVEFILNDSVKKGYILES